MNVLQGSAPVAETCFVRSREAVWSLTTSEAVATFPFPPCVDVTAVVVLFFVPEVVPVTVTLKVQFVFAASDPPLNVIVPGAVVVSDPAQVAIGPLEATVIPAGSVSLKLIPLKRVLKFGLVMVNVSVDVLPVKIELGANDFARAGGAFTVNGAVA